MMSDIMTIMEQKFTSGNDVPVTMSRITSEEWYKLLCYVKNLKTENEILRDEICELKGDVSVLESMLDDVSENGE